MIDAAGGVGVDDFQRVLCCGEGVAEAGDVHAGELELGGGVEAREPRPAAVQPVRDNLGHGVGRGHEAQAHAVKVGYFSDRPNAGDLRLAVLGDHHSAARAQRERLVVVRPGRVVGGVEQLVAGPHPDGDNHQVGGDDTPVGHQDAGDLAVAVGQDFGRAHTGVHGEAPGPDQAPQGLPGALVQLGVHEPGGAVDDDGSGAKLLGAGGRFQTEQPATDGDGVDCAAQGLCQFPDGEVDGTDIFESAVDVGVFGARDRKPDCGGAGGDHQVVIRVARARRGGDGLGRDVDAGDALAGLQREELVVPQGSAQGEVDGGIGEGLAQRNAVIGRVRFLGQDGDIPALEAPGVHGVREPVGGRSAAGNHDPVRCCSGFCALMVGA